MTTDKKNAKPTTENQPQPEVESLQVGRGTGASGTTIYLDARYASGSRIWFYTLEQVRTYCNQHFPGRKIEFLDPADSE